MPESSHRLIGAALWAAPWSLGIGVGLAIGAWLTATGGLGAPGAASLDMRDVLVVPVIGTVVTFVALWASRALLMHLRRTRD